MAVSTAPAVPALSSTMRVAVLRLARRLRTERADTSLTLTQLAALATLERHGLMTAGELAAYEKVQPPSMTRVLAALAQRGLITREPDAADRRQVRVAVSDAGVALLRDDRRRRDAWLARRLGELSDDDRTALLAAAPVLERLAAS